MILRSAALVLLGLSLRTEAGARPTVWKDYANPRFAFQVCYPDWLKAGPIPTNGDGRVFTDRSGGELRVWGSYATMVLIDGKEELSDEAPAATVVRQAADFEAKSLSPVTYRTVHHDWYALSGRTKGKIVYLKTIVPDDRWVTLQITYPVGAAAKWKPAIERMASCFRALPPAQFDEPRR